MKYDATRLPRHWCVRPVGTIGLAGWNPDPWQAVFIDVQTVGDAAGALEAATIVRQARSRSMLLSQGFVRLVSIPGAVMYGHDDGRCATVDSNGEVKRYSTREEMARALLKE